MQKVTSDLASSITSSQQDILNNQEYLRQQLTNSTDKLDSKLTQSLKHNEKLLEDQETALGNQRELMDVSTSMATHVQQVRSRESMQDSGLRTGTETETGDWRLETGLPSVLGSCMKFIIRWGMCSTCVAGAIRPCPCQRQPDEAKGADARYHTRDGRHLQHPGKHGDCCMPAYYAIH